MKALRSWSPARCFSGSLWCVLGAGIFAITGAKASAAQATPLIRVTNYQSNEMVRYPVVLLQGVIENVEAASVLVVNHDSKLDSSHMEGQAYKGRFKALCELVPGANHLSLTANGAELSLTLRYLPQTTGHLVRIIYMTDRTGNTSYVSPFAEDKQDYEAKMSTAMKLLQTFTAETLYELGFGRVTFRLEYNPDGSVRVHTFKGALAAQEYYKLNPNAWSQRVAEEMEKPFPTVTARNLVMAAYTRLDPKTGQWLGHAALGGGGQGLFGGACLFTWPSRLADVQKTFQDRRTMDGTKFYTSSYRTFAGDTVWGTAATSLGCTLHELGHAFGLLHTQEPQDIMTRGFDHFNRFFSLYEPGANGAPKEFSRSAISCFPLVSALPLRLSPWFELDVQPAPPPEGTQILMDENTGQVMARSPCGIGYLAASKEGYIKYYLTPKDAQRTVPVLSVPLATLTDSMGSEEFSILAVDSAGRWSRTTSAFLNRDFTGKWSGRWSNSQGAQGADTMDVQEQAKGTVTGSWSGSIAWQGERVAKDIFYFETDSRGTRYQVAGSLAGEQLTLDYAAQNGKEHYYGCSVLQRTGSAMEIPHPPDLPLSGHWKGAYQNSAGAKGEDSLQLAESGGGILSGVWSGMKIKGRRLGYATFYLDSKSSGRTYKAVGQRQQDSIRLSYTVSDGKTLSLGESRLTQSK